MLFLLMFFASNGFGMQQAIVEGQDIFFRDISVRQLACYAINPPENKKLVLPQNWLAMDRESQLCFFSKNASTAGGEIGNEEYRSNWNAYLINTFPHPKICTFISGQQEMKDFCINDYYLGGHNGTDGFIWDGIEFVPSAKSSYADDSYTWVSGRKENGTFSSIFFISMRENHHKTDGHRPGLINSGLVKTADCSACAIKYPYSAYCMQDINKKNFLNIITRLSLYGWSNSLFPIEMSFTKISWLRGKNLLGLNEQGDIITINADTGKKFTQNFGKKKFLDVAVDQKHPHHFIALTTDFSIIYADFSSHHASVKKDIHWIIWIYNYLFSIPNEVTASFNKLPKKPLERKLTYRTIMHLDPINDSQTYKIWFHNDKIGVYCGEKDNTNGTFDIYTLEDRIFTFNMSKVRRNGSEKCLTNETLQLDCHKNQN